MSRRRPNPHKVISPSEAERGIYIDCEGFEDQAPTLIGVLIGDDLDQIVLDPELQPAAIAKGLRVSVLSKEASRLQQLSVREERLIVAYSQHERNLLMTYAQIDITDCYRDALMIAKRWKSILYPEAWLNGRGLKDFLEFIGFPRGVHLGHQKSTKRIKAVRDMLRVKGSFEALTPVKKAQWTKLLEHNAIDCRGMRALVIRASAELATRSPHCT
jgi:hypothetical protein